MPTDGGGDDSDPHGGEGVVSAGAPRGAADAALVALHGRGATAQGVVNLTEPLHRHGVAVVAPQGARSRWFPYAASEPVERNEPHLSSALAAVERALRDVRDWGVPAERVVLFGFSQGAALACEYAARNPARYGGVAALSGGLLGPDPSARSFTGSLDGTPVLFGYGTADDRLDAERVAASAAVFRALDAEVSVREYDGVGHAVTDDEFDAVGAMLDSALAAAD
jgi:phospholipase/carboxylesterase